MSTFNDFTFDDEINYDQTPEEQFNEVTGINDTIDLVDPVDTSVEDGTYQDEPGAGDSYQGTDPTVFNEQDELTDEPAANPDPVTLGEQDDPESNDNPLDEDEGDDENDKADPAGILPQLITNSFAYPEQGQDSDELTVKSPERIAVDIEETPKPEVEEVAEGTVTEEYRDSIYQYLVQILEADPNLEVEETDADNIIEFVDNNTLFGRNLLAEHYEALDSLDLSAEMADALDIDLVGELEDALSTDILGNMEKAWTGDLADKINKAFDNAENYFTSPSLIIDFADVGDSVDALTYLNEFQWVDNEYV
jgi:hypothetical protein